ncbi:MAG: polyprenyl synthetase family protein [Candidatus Nanoarchaeia archaeon]|nr:polyprenyl synthetase family protein [Candidatus Nanoarchaeia archaeon]
MENIETYREKVNSLLKSFLNKKLEKNRGVSPYINNLIENLTEYTLRGGKRIRPLTTIFAYKCFKDDNKIIDVSLSLELMQSYLLIHDDIMDKSNLRRGLPTIHKLYEKEFNPHLSLSAAILAGDLCSSYIYDIILESKFSPKEKIEAIKYISWILEREILGQTMDVLPNFKELTEKDIWKLYELKTATYTMQGPIYIGSILANAPEEKIKKLQEYAYNIGIAFQLHDDVNGIFGNTKETGKPNDSDAKEGKKTLLITKTLELCSKEEKEFIFKNWGTKEISSKDLETIKKIIKNSGAFEYCQKKVNELIEKGKSSIKNIELRQEGKTYLLEMADYIKNLY